MNNLALAAALATAPTSAFAELRERPRFWFPLLLLVLTTAAINYWYFSMVDVEWIKDTMIGNDPNVSEAERAAAMGMLTRTTLLWGAMVGVIVGTPLVFLAWAVYLLLAAKVTKLPLGFKHWFAFSCWTSLPMLLSTVVAAIFLILSDNAQVNPSLMAPLSLNSLVLHVPMGPGYAFYESMTIPGVLSWILMIIGVRTWSQRSWTFSSIFILLAVVVYYGIWSTFAFR
jgi:uncharacterized membrane protein YhdT